MHDIEADPIELVKVSIEIPKGGEVLVVLAQLGTALWCASVEPRHETLRHLRAALKQLEEQQ